MNVRNPKYNAVGTIDCEIEHPVYGWIPFTASPDDTEEQGKEIYEKALLETYGAVAEYTPPVLTTEALLKENNAAYNTATKSITGEYPDSEKDTWPSQKAESEAWVWDATAKTAWIDRASAVRGLEREDYLRRTLAKAYQFRELSAFLTGLRQSYEDAIKAGAVPVIDYTVPSSLYQELQQHSYSIMTAPYAELKDLI